MKTCPPLLIPPYSNTICKNPDLNLSFDYTPRNLTFLQLFDPEKDFFTEAMPIDTGEFRLHFKGALKVKYFAHLSRMRVQMWTRILYGWFFKKKLSSTESVTLGWIGNHLQT